MLLKCTETAKKEFERCHAECGCTYPLEVGKVYDVVEIFEKPDHVMVREPGAAKWPVPGDPSFALHAYEVFDPMDIPIEIVSCGYDLNDYVDDMFGVIIDDPVDVARLAQLYELQYEYEDSDLDDYEQWRTRFASELPEWLARAWHEIETSFEPCMDLAIHTDVFFPKDIKHPFAAVGFHYNYRDFIDRSLEESSQFITEYLGKLRINCPEPDHIGQPYWTGDGSPRLINSVPTDE